MKKNILLNLSNKHNVGVYCVCTANASVIKAALSMAKEKNSLLVVEATANQVNQFGGYTGMTPADFKGFVHRLATEMYFPIDKLILGGDHLGPLTWIELPYQDAMKNACDLVYAYAHAGYTKLHLDTSMRLSSDAKNEILSNEIIAIRSVKLAEAAMQGYEDLKTTNPDAIFPVFIIGSEVPIPGGAQESEDTIEVTRPEEFLKTHHVFQDIYIQHGMQQVFDNVIGMVVQPGVEFGDTDLFMYDSKKASELVEALKSNFSNLCFEGHSTDYQPLQSLIKMVEDGITILKVGPALTFAYREALFALSFMEDILLDKPSGFREILDAVMVGSPNNWEKHYHGSKQEQAFKRKYSYSDRVRYYLPHPQVDQAIDTLISNLHTNPIPDTLLSQFMPYQYRHYKEKRIMKDPESLIIDYIKLYLNDYEVATQSSKLSDHS